MNARPPANMSAAVVSVESPTPTVVTPAASRRSSQSRMTDGPSSGALGGGSAGQSLRFYVKGAAELILAR